MVKRYFFGPDGTLYAEVTLADTCANGHSLSPLTVKLREGGRRIVCHECEKARSRKHKRRVLGVKRPRV